MLPVPVEFVELVAARHAPVGTAELAELEEDEVRRHSGAPRAEANKEESERAERRARVLKNIGPDVS